jgi:hypothetical protein
MIRNIPAAVGGFFLFCIGITVAGHPEWLGYAVMLVLLAPAMVMFLVRILRPRNRVIVGPTRFGVLAAKWISK